MRFPAFLVVLVAFFVCLPVLASNPGEPLDCSDWSINLPGISCSIETPIGTLSAGSVWLDNGGNLAADNEGFQYALQWNVPVASGNPRIDLGTLNIVRFDGQTEQVIATISERNFPADGRDHIRPREASCGGVSGCGGGRDGAMLSVGDHLRFDKLSGQLLIPVESYCTTSFNTGCPVNPYGGGWWIMALEGFSTLFEIVQSYTPPSGPLSFRVPAHPDGLEQADHFDTYYGDIADLPDFSKATAMSCDYPASPPSVGDYFTVVDTSPTPAAGEATYIVTAVDDGAETRIGRQQIGGAKSGRDPTGLPGCP